MPKWTRRPKDGTHRVAIPAALAIKVRAIAKREGRGFTGQVIFMLQEAIEVRRMAPGIILSTAELSAKESTR